jgi:Zn finger protein HypA/HybF involved in hydrogenase expression
MNKCDYGCGKEFKHILKNGKKCCELSPNKCDEVKNKNSKGLKKAYEEGRKEKNYDLNHLEGKRNWKKNKTIFSDPRVGIKYSKEQIFSENSPISNSALKKIILTESLIKYKCECGIENEWIGKKIELELDHINGNNKDNRIINLRFLCPNCHSQTDTFRGKNINKGKVKVDDFEIKKMILTGLNNRQILLGLNLAPKGANYKRLDKLRDEIFNITV